MKSTTLPVSHACRTPSAKTTVKTYIPSSTHPRCKFRSQTELGDGLGFFNHCPVSTTFRLVS